MKAELKNQNSVHSKINLIDLKLLRIYFWVISYLKPYIFQVILILLCGAAITACEMSIPGFIQVFIDKIVKHKDYNLFPREVAILVAIILLMLGLNAAYNLLRRVVQEKAARDMQYSVFSQLRALGFSYFENNPTGETLSLLNTDVLALQEIYRQYLPGMIRMLLAILIPLSIIAYTNLKLALIALGCYVLYFIIGPYYNKMVTIYLKKQTDDRKAMNKKIYDSICAIQEIRAYSAQAWDLGRLHEKYDTYRGSRLTSLLYRHLRGSLSRLISNLGVLLFFIFGSMLVKSGDMTVGQFVAFAFYFVMVMRMIGGIAFMVTEQTHVLYQAVRLFDFSNLQPDVKEPKQPRSIERVGGTISFKNVHFGYPNRPDVLNGFNLDIHKGERVALVGTSGNGKSTVLKLIPRFYDPQEGEIILDGVPLKDLPLSQIRDNMGYVFQETYLFGSSIRENIRFGNPVASDEEIMNAAKAAYAHEFIMEMPDKYDTLVGERGIKLSGGQKQRIAIARMFIKNPSIILLDEATSALDNISEIYVKKALDEFMEGRTTIAIAHRLSTIKDYDRIVVVDNGRAAEIGSYEELLKKEGLFFNLLKGGDVNE